MAFDPKTLAEARAHRYGVWAGNPKGQPYSEGDCIKEFVPDERGAISRQCNRRATAGPDRAFCSTHNPERLAKAKAERAQAEAHREDRQAAIEARGKALIKRLGAGMVHWHSSPRFSECGLREFVCVPFDKLEELLNAVKEG